MLATWWKQHAARLRPQGKELVELLESAGLVLAEASE